MKYIFMLIRLLLCSTLFAQGIDTSRYVINGGYGYQYKEWKVDSALMVPKTGDTLSKLPGLLKVIPGTDLLGFVGNSRFWTILSPPDLSNYIQKESQNPIATLTSNQTLEYKGTGTTDFTLNWSATRQSATTTAQATADISSIVIGGVSQTYTHPSPGSSVSGIQTVTVTNNANTPFSNIVTASDSKTATASITISWLPKRFFGWISDTTALRSGSINTIINALSGEQSASKIKSWNTGSPTGTQFYVFAYYITAGTLTRFDFNGFPSIDAMSVVNRSITTTNGYIGNYYIYWNKLGQTSSSDLSTQ